MSGRGGGVPAKGLSMTHDFTRTRPESLTDKTGSSGRKIDLRSNFIPVKSSPTWLLYQYHVGFQPMVDSKFVRGQLLREHKEKLGTEQPVFDGMILYLSFKIHGTTAKDPNAKVIWTSFNERTGEKVELTIRLTCELPPTSPQCITVLNLCNRKAFEILSYRQFGRHFFNPNLASYIERHKMEIWPGLISSIRCYEEGLLLQVEMAHKLLRLDTVKDQMLDIMKRNGQQGYDECIRALVGATVLTRYNNKTYRIDDIIWNKSPRDKFEKSDGTTISYAEYYKTQYGREVTEMDQPLLLSRGKKRGGEGDGESQDVFLVPELSAMTGLTDQMREDRRVMQDLAHYTRVSPDKRVADARGYVKSLTGSPAVLSLFSQWGLSLETDLVKVEGRVLDPQALMYGMNRETKYRPETADWSRESKGAKVLEAVHLSRWVIIYPEKEESCAGNFFDQMTMVGPPIGIQVSKPMTLPLSSDSTVEYVEALRKVAQEGGVQLVLVVVPNDNKTRYDAVKKECCLENPIPSQVVLAASLKKQNILQSVCAKIMFQMNCKLGGTLWKVSIPMKRAMVIGYDSYHDSTARGKSVGAAVFSLNPELTRWLSKSALHSESGDQIANLTDFTKEALQMYQKMNGFLPDRIFLYRDGVGEGQIPVVYHHELPQMQKALADIYGEHAEEEGLVKFCFTIVTKRVNTRFFEETGKVFGNPPPGTIVDTVVTRSERYDFFMIPQCVRQGTVTPVSYNVIYDRSGLKPDHLQKLAYKLCHLYYNWQGTIRVPAPCQYAHKLAFLVAQSLHEPARGDLGDKLFFL